MAQLDIFADMPAAENSQFQQYHKKHPEVYQTFVKLTLQTIKKGFKRFSARGIFQVMRWLRKGEIKDDGYKYNNNYTPYYVRLFEHDYPMHVGFFEKRKLKQTA